MRAALKRALMWLYCRELIPARAVTVAFRVFRLRAE
jgi:hypothetical protein